MGAFNWIIVEETCPVCRQRSTIRCQTHIASDFDGDTRGLFHDREYHLGDRMLWWPRGDARFQGWRVGGRMENSIPPDSDEEACYSNCTNCGAELCVVVNFLRAIPRRVVLVAREEDWPPGYNK